MDHFHVSATGHSINYFPEYLADELGYFADVDLQVTAEVPQPWTRLMTDLHEGKVHAALSGLWLPAMYRSRVREYYAFAQIASRCPMALISRTPVETFDWGLLQDKTVLLAGGNGLSGLPLYMYVAGLFRRAGYTPDQARLVHDLDTSMLAELYIGGMGDIIAADPVTAAALVGSGAGYYAANLAELGGVVPWSVYFATPEMLERSDNLIGRFTSAIHRSMLWIKEHSLEDARDVVQKHWPDDVDRFTEMMTYFKAQGMWDDVQIDENAVAGWQTMMADAGIIEKPLFYHELVNDGPVDFAKNGGE